MEQHWTLDNIYDPILWVGDLRLMGEHWFQITPNQEIKIQITKGVNSYLIFRFENHLEPGEQELKWEDSVAIGEENFEKRYGDANGVVFYFRHLQLGDDIVVFNRKDSSKLCFGVPWFGNMGKWLSTFSKSTISRCCSIILFALRNTDVKYSTKR